VIIAFTWRAPIGETTHKHEGVKTQTDILTINKEALNTNISILVFLLDKFSSYSMSFLLPLKLANKQEVILPSHLLL